MKGGIVARKKNASLVIMTEEKIDTGTNIDIVDTAWIHWIDRKDLKVLKEKEKEWNDWREWRAILGIENRDTSERNVPRATEY